MTRTGFVIDYTPERPYLRLWWRGGRRKNERHVFTFSEGGTKPSVRIYTEDVWRASLLHAAWKKGLPLTVGSRETFYGEEVITIERIANAQEVAS